MKQAFCYNQNYEFIGGVTCYLDPLELEKNGIEVYLLPANATFVEPPYYNEETQYIQWDGMDWSIKDIPTPEPQPPEPSTPNLEDRVMAVEAENTKLKAELEVTQAVVDELLFGGAL